MQILLYILFGIAVVLAILVFLVILRPADFRIQRTGKIAAPPSAVFPQVNDFHHWIAWSPWEKLDPALKRTFEGPPSGTGAKYGWVGNKNVGEGRMTITESRPSDLVRIKLEFIKPFAAVSTTEFTFVPEGNETVVTWTMSGTNNFMMKAFGLFMNMDKMIGAQFEQGLAQMKAVVEKKA